MVTVRKFGATWCGPCKALAPVLKQLKEEYTDVSFLEYDVDEEEDAVLQYGITSVPTVIIEKDFGLVEKIIGLKPKSVYTTALNKLL